MTVWIVIIIRGLMTNIHDQLVVVVHVCLLPLRSCLRVVPISLCSPQPISTPTRERRLLRAQHHDDDDNCSIFGARSQAAKPLEVVMELAPGPGVR